VGEENSKNSLMTNPEADSIKFVVKQMQFPDEIAIDGEEEKEEDEDDEDYSSKSDELMRDSEQDELSKCEPEENALRELRREKREFKPKNYLKAQQAKKPTQKPSGCIRADGKKKVELIIQTRAQLRSKNMNSQ